MSLHKIFLATVIVLIFSSTHGEVLVEILQPTGGLPAHIVGSFNSPLNFHQDKDGNYLVFDRLDHTVYTIDAQETTVKKIVKIGQEQGRIIQPSAFDTEPGGTFIVADGPNRRERLQIFGPKGVRIGGFTLPGRNTARITIGSRILNGVGSVQYTGRSILINQPETGALITEYGLAGRATRSIGNLRSTGHENNRDVHMALNTGFPLVDPQGGFYFVFQAGRPLFRKYDKTGKLLFERHIEGPVLDNVIQGQPTTWPTRSTDNSTLPFIQPLIRIATVDPLGNLWVSLMRPFTYVYDKDGDKQRVVQFRAAGLISPTSLFFSTSKLLLITPGCYEFTIS
jgi:hypothetical protein